MELNKEYTVLNEDRFLICDYIETMVSTIDYHFKNEKWGKYQNEKYKNELVKHVKEKVIERIEKEFLLLRKLEQSRENYIKMPGFTPLALKLFSMIETLKVYDLIKFETNNLKLQIVNISLMELCKCFGYSKRLTKLQAKEIERAFLELKNKNLIKNYSAITKDNYGTILKYKIFLSIGE